jgi:Mn2+/Fe2+ NRAMP family transporter
MKHLDRLDAFLLGITTGIAICFVIVFMVAPRQCDPFQAWDGLPTYFQCVMEHRR